MEWKFKKLTPDDTKGDPSHLEFFRSEVLENPIDALIREDIQNRLDAKSNSWPVRVSYFLNSEGLPDSSIQKWFPNFQEHINAPQVLDELREQPFQLGNPVPYLVIEDFNTTGLKGDVEQTEDPNPNENRNDFYWFIRNVGRSGKKAGDRGRWGLGKIVYAAASRIHSFFAYSIRNDDPTSILVGRSVLTIHRTDDGEFDSEGYFGEYKSSEHKYFSTPSSDKSFINKFISDFKITRKNDQPGLSLVIPFPDDSITINGLIQSVIDHYFWEILAEHLVVTVSNNQKSYELSKENISNFVQTWSGFTPDKKTEIRRMIEFCDAANEMKLRDDGYFILKRSKNFKWNDVKSLFDKDSDPEGARKMFREDKMLAIEVPIKISKSNDSENGKDSSFMIYVQKDTEFNKPSETFIRNGLTIIGQRALKEPGIRTLMVAEDGPITEFLGDAENPAHTKWLTTTKHFRGKYNKGPTLLSFIKNSSARLANFLAKVEGMELISLLSDIFSIPEDGEDIPPQPQPKPGPNPPVEPVPPLPPRSLYLSIDKFQHGFAIKNNIQATSKPDRINIRVAYETIRGNPFTQWQPADFNFSERQSNVKFKSVGCSILEKFDNRIIVVVRDDKFSLTISGFDLNRDLIVDAKAERQTQIEKSEND